MRIPCPTCGDPILIPSAPADAGIEVYECFGYDLDTQEWLVALDNESLLLVKFARASDDGVAIWQGSEPRWTIPQEWYTWEIPGTFEDFCLAFDLQPRWTVVADWLNPPEAP